MGQLGWVFRTGQRYYHCGRLVYPLSSAHLSYSNWPDASSYWRGYSLSLTRNQCQTVFRHSLSSSEIVFAGYSMYGISGIIRGICLLLRAFQTGLRSSEVYVFWSGTIFRWFSTLVSFPATSNRRTGCPFVELLSCEYPFVVLVFVNSPAECLFR